MKSTKIAINGFGRIGRSFFRAAFAAPSEALAKDGTLPSEALLVRRNFSEGGAKEGPTFDIVAINDLTDTRTLGYLLKYDSVYGRYKKTVEATDGFLRVEGKDIKVLAEKEPAKLPWRDLGVDIVIESSGIFTTAEKARAHLDAGAKKVVITAPATGDVTTALIGVNDDRFEKAGPITCNASCTTNSVAPVVAILNEKLGIKKSAMVTVHGYTATQKLVDGPDSKDPRRGRAAGVNIVPSTTGAAEAVIQALPELTGKFDATSVRVPTITGSLSVVTALVEKETTVEEINKIFEKSAGESRWSKILKATNDPIVSTDIIGEPYGAIIDLFLTKVVDKNLVKVFSWYDNEAGYTATLIEHVKRVADNI